MYLWRHNWFCRYVIIPWAINPTVCIYFLYKSDCMHSFFVRERQWRSGASRPRYYCAPLVCVSAVLELLAVWRHNKPKTKNFSCPACPWNSEQVILRVWLLYHQTDRTSPNSEGTVVVTQSSSTLSAAPAASKDDALIDLLSLLPAPPAPSFLFFLLIKPKKLYSASCVGREVNPLGVITHGQKNIQLEANAKWHFIQKTSKSLTEISLKKIHVTRSIKFVRTKRTFDSKL